MSDYFCNIYNFRNLALSRQKQAPVKTLSAFNDFGSGNIVCGQSDWSFYGRNFAHKPFITFLVSIIGGIPGVTLMLGLNLFF